MCSEPSTDLAIALAIASSYYDCGVPQTMAAVGEMGLAGELRCGSACHTCIAWGSASCGDGLQGLRQQQFFCFSVKRC